jgi:hypothetical protein
MHAMAVKHGGKCVDTFLKGEESRPNDLKIIVAWQH